MMCVRLTSLSIDRVRRRRPTLRDRPLALVTGDRRSGVAAACPLARADGVRVGMALAEARALCPALAHQPHDELLDARLLERVGRWMAARFSPQVAVEPPESIFAEIGGSVRLLGGLDVIARQAVLAMRWLKLSAVVSVAPTAGGAFALAAGGRQQIIDDETAVAAAIENMAVGTLRVDPAIADALAHVGVVTIGQLARLPRSALPARFGPTLLLRLDQATGRAVEPLDWLPPRTPVREAMRFETPIDSHEAIACVLERLVAGVVAELSRRGCGARRLVVRFDGEKPPPVIQTVTLSRPTRRAKAMIELLRLATESLRARGGFVVIELSAPELQRTADTQTAFDADADEAEKENVDDWVDRVRAKLGDAAVVRPRLVESHVPERAFGHTRDGGGVTCLAVPPRPMSLSATPVEINVIVTPSHDREGRPVAFTHAGVYRDLRWAVGPERIAGEWWTGQNKTRDYFDVEDEFGRRFWLFRVTETGKWYVHGVFE